MLTSKLAGAQAAATGQQPKRSSLLKVSRRYVRHIDSICLLAPAFPLSVG